MFEIVASLIIAVVGGAIGGAIVALVYVGMVILIDQMDRRFGV